MDLAKRGRNVKKLTDPMIYMMEKSFKQQMDKAATSGDRKKFEQMQKQLQWLHEYKINKYKN